MAERFKAHAWKVCVLSKVPWVRIPLSPPSPHKQEKHLQFKDTLGLNYTYFYFNLNL